MIAGIGHNNGPVVEGARWRTHCWRQARAALLPVLPVEVVRLRVRRAKALGLEYKTYAGIRATTGRDLIAFLFSSNALAVFRDGDLSAARKEAVMRIDAARHLGCAPGLDADALATRIGAASAIHLPQFGTSWSAMRDDIKLWLHDQRLTGDSVLMIGETDHEKEIMAAGGLAGFISGARYFGDAERAI